LLAVVACHTLRLLDARKEYSFGNSVCKGFKGGRAHGLLPRSARALPRGTVSFPAHCTQMNVITTGDDDDRFYNALIPDPSLSHLRPPHNI
jgi:hypothetical protein